MRLQPPSASSESPTCSKKAGLQPSTPSTVISYAHLHTSEHEDLRFFLCE